MHLCTSTCCSIIVIELSLNAWLAVLFCGRTLRAIGCLLCFQPYWRKLKEQTICHVAQGDPETQRPTHRVLLAGQHLLMCGQRKTASCQNGRQIKPAGKDLAELKPTNSCG